MLRAHPSNVMLDPVAGSGLARDRGDQGVFLHRHMTMRSQRTGQGQNRAGRVGGGILTRRLRRGPASPLCGSWSAGPVSLAFIRFATQGGSLTISSTRLLLLRVNGDLTQRKI